MYSYAILQQIGESGNITAYGWSEVCDGTVLDFCFNNYNNSGVSTVQFKLLQHNKTIVDGQTTRQGNPKFKYKYIVHPDDNSISLCREYKIVFFEPCIAKINRNKLSMKLIVTRACEKFERQYLISSCHCIEKKTNTIVIV